MEDEHMYALPSQQAGPHYHITKRNNAQRTYFDCGWLSFAVRGCTDADASEVHLFVEWQVNDELLVRVRLEHETLIGVPEVGQRALASGVQAIRFILCDHLVQQLSRRHLGNKLTVQRWSFNLTVTVSNQSHATTSKRASGRRSRLY
jgi:hypothetical protein